MTKAKPLPHVELIREFLDYNKETGDFYWICHMHKSRIGTKAGKLHKNNKYVILRINGNQYLAHRIAWLLCTGQDPLKLQIDHIDGNGCNNKIKNLRLATNMQNGYNRKMNTNNTSGYKGVSFDKRNNKWVAEIMFNGNHKYLGLFCLPELAHMAYCKAAAELHGDFACGA